MVERCRYRLQWVTWLAVLLGGGAIARCQFVEIPLGIEGSLTWSVQGDLFGWPMSQVHRTITSEWLATGSMTTIEYSWDVPSLLLNVVIGVLVVCSTTFTVEGWMRSPSPTQFTLRNLLGLMGAACCLLALAHERFAIARGLSKLGLTAISLMHWGSAYFFGPEGFVFLIPILFGLGCTIYTAGSLAARLIGGILALRGRH